MGKILRPVIIFGLPRTGTTFLHNLLATNKREFRVPLHWEYVDPIPDTGVPGDEAHMAEITNRLDQYKQLLPGFDAVHPMGPLMPEECVASFAAEFDSLLFEATMNVSQYTDWMLSQSSHEHALEWHAKHLKFLQHQRPMDRRRWLLKTPWYLGLLDQLVDRYPDALFIQTHRRPDKALASSASIHARTYGAASDHIDLHAIGHLQYSIYQELMSRALAARRSWAADPDRRVRVLDVHLTDLKNDP